MFEDKRHMVMQMLIKHKIDMSGLGVKTYFRALVHIIVLPKKLYYFFFINKMWLFSKKKNLKHCISTFKTHVMVTVYRGYSQEKVVMNSLNSRNFT